MLGNTGEFGRVTRGDRVLVTNAAGFIAGWIVRQLLEDGHNVHATVADLANNSGAHNLEVLARRLPGKLKLHDADTMLAANHDNVMAGCKVVFHTSSPFLGNFVDPRKKLIEQTVTGAINVLQSACRTQSVEKVILTSSCTTMYGDNADFANAPGGCFTESMWNTTSTPNHQSYCYAKTAAEKAAWEIAEAQDRFRLITINPGMVLGPSLAGTTTSEAHHIVSQLANGATRFGVPHFEIGTADVRDVAEAHLKAAFLPKAQGRYIVYASVNSLLDLSDTLHDEFGDRFPFPRHELPKSIAVLIGPILNPLLSRKMVMRNIGYRWKGDNTRSVHELGLRYRPTEEPLIEMFQQLVENGVLKPRKGH